MIRALILTVQGLLSMGLLSILVLGFLLSPFPVISLMLGMVYLLGLDTFPVNPVYIMMNILPIISWTILIHEERTAIHADTIKIQGR